MRTNWSLVVTLLLAGLFAAAQFGKLTLSIDALRALYPDPPGIAPILISILGVVGIVLGAVAGAVVARAGIRRAVIGALLAGGALSLLEALTPPMPVFLGLRVLEGLSHLAIVVAAPTLMANAASDASRPFVMGVWAAFFGIAMAILALILPPLLASGGLPRVFVLHGLGMWVIAALLFPLLPKDEGGQVARPSYLREHKIIYSAPHLILPGAGFMWYTILYIALLAVLPSALALESWAVAALPLISIGGTLLGGWIAKFIPPDRVVATGFLATALATIICWLGPEAWLWPYFLLFAVMAFIPAGSFAAIPFFNSSQIDRVRATGGIAQLGNVGTTLGTPIFVLAFAQAGLWAVFTIVLVFCAIGAALTLGLRRRIGAGAK